MTIDQAVSGASNIITAIIAARMLSAAGFGLFGIVFLEYTLLIGVTRAFVSDVALLHPTESREQPGVAIGASFVVSTLLALVLGCVGLALRHWTTTLGDASLVLAACLPLLALQDLGRYLGFATERPTRALILDTAWLVAMIGLVVALFVGHNHNLPLLIGAWGVAGGIAGLGIFSWYDIRRVRPGLSWLRQTWGIGWRYVLIYGSNQGAALAMASEVGAIAGARALGGVQGTVLLIRPFTNFQVAASTSCIGAVARSRGDRRTVWRLAVKFSAVTAVVAAANAAVMLVLPTSIGKAFLGASWHAAKPLLLPAAAGLVASALLAAPAGALVGMKRMSTALRLQSTNAVLLVGSAAAGAAISGAKGAMWFLAAEGWLLAIMFWTVFALNLRTAAAGQPLGLSALLLDGGESVGPSAGPGAPPRQPELVPSPLPVPATAASGTTLGIGAPVSWRRPIGLAGLLAESAGADAAVEVAAARWLPPDLVGTTGGD